MGRQLTNPPAVTVQGTVNTLQSQSGRIPQAPSILTPATGTNLTDFLPTFTSSTFFVYNNDTHVGSNWQIATDAAFTNVVIDHATKSNLTSWQPASPQIIPRVVGTYFVRVRYISIGNEISPWSLPISFNVTRTLLVTTTFNGSSAYNVRIQYSGTAHSSDPSSFNVLISANSDMSSPLVNTNVAATSRVANLAVNYTTLPGFMTGTQYFVRITPVAGNAAVVTPEVQPMVSPASPASAPPAPALTAATSTVNQSQNVAVATGTPPTAEWQFSTTQTFDAVAFSTVQTSFAASNLPGLTARSQPYWARFVLVVGSDRPIVGGVSRVIARDVFSAAGAFSGSIPASYAGAITVTAIGGGGGGGGSAYGAAGGGGGGFATQQGYTVTASQSFSGSVGAAGGGGYWTGEGSSGGGTTFTLSGNAQISVAGGNGGLSNQAGGTGGTGGTNGASFGTQNGRGGGNFGVFGLGGQNGGFNTTGPGGQGGFGWGAGGGGALRDSSSGSSGNWPGGGGGGLAFDSSVKAGDGAYGNVESGGNGLRGAVVIEYVQW
jgi:hypothetical protein